MKDYLSSDSYLDWLVTDFIGTESDEVVSRRYLQYLRIKQRVYKKRHKHFLKTGVRVAVSPRSKTRVFHPLIKSCSANNTKRSTWRCKRYRNLQFKRLPWPAPLTAKLLRKKNRIERELSSGCNLKKLEEIQKSEWVLFHQGI
tara:strand:- start:292 stop:720 length:429 start_codon:yes stop_codon:yes gene_type:complete